MPKPDILRYPVSGDLNLAAAGGNFLRCQTGSSENEVYRLWFCRRLGIVIGER